MSDIITSQCLPGMAPPERFELPRSEDRISFIYLEDCRLERDDGAIRAVNAKGFLDIPAAGVTVLLLGPGTTVTHRAIQCAVEAKLSIAWVGEQGVRFYAHGSPLSGNAALLHRQAYIVSHPAERLKAAKFMYNLRYPDEDVSWCTLKQLLGKEGRNVTRCYSRLAKEYGLCWTGRKYDPNNFESNAPLQNALTCANACLYGLCWAVILAMGLSPGLGLVHTGMDKSFVLDIADLYKERTAFPAAFQVTAAGTEDIEGRIRRKMRDFFKDTRLPGTIWKDIRSILQVGDAKESNLEGRNALWYDFTQQVEGGVNYGNDRHKSD